MNENGHGGVRAGGGRPPKADEIALIKKLSPLADIAFAALKKGIEQNQSWAVKMFFEYSYGKPKEVKEIEIKEAIRKIGFMDVEIINE